MTIAVVYTLATIAINAILCAVLNHHNVNKTYPAFYSYSFFNLFASGCCLVVILTCGNQTTYFFTYYVLAFFGGFLAALVAAELAGKLLGPAGALPSWVTLKLFRLIGAGAAAALATAALLRASRGGLWARSLVTAEQWMAGMFWVAFSAILIFWRTLRVFRRQARAASLCAGFVLYFTVSTFAVFLRGRGGLEYARAAQHAGMIAYLVMLAWWSCVFLMKAPVFEKSTPEKSCQIFSEFEETRKAAARAAIVPLR